MVLAQRMLRLGQASGWALALALQLLLALQL